MLEPFFSTLAKTTRVCSFLKWSAEPAEESSPWKLRWKVTQDLLALQSYLEQEKTKAAEGASEQYVFWSEVYADWIMLILNCDCAEHKRNQYLCAFKREMHGVLNY